MAQWVTSAFVGMRTYVWISSAHVKGRVGEYVWPVVPEQSDGDKRMLGTSWSVSLANHWVLDSITDLISKNE